MAGIDSANASEVSVVGDRSLGTPERGVPQHHVSDQEGDYGQADDYLVGRGPQKGPDVLGMGSGDLKRDVIRAEDQGESSLQYLRSGCRHDQQGH
jgi:hypothetical protein